ncbi:putative ABC transporter permease subunit [Oceanirhabdus sp. W0125-5]|uniref:putative ABC transporter permease subunit n=1 Tax=Oceanirhabdus sp. W0125-5 TaxID=2999116 RepID=UPI0022F30A86|nr:hypothetical protein [Oceanirhabdus sp. W0125-5]WBW97073.1 hypothetical protein OW730_25790 [Oceanirhabdus sp. W0125-5]
MNKYLTLTRVLLKNGSGFFVDKGNKRSIKEFLIPIILIVSFLPLTIGISQFISTVYDQLVMMNQEGLILGIGLSMVSLMVFTFGILYSLNTFYFSMDIESLLYIPLKPWHIISGKFTVVLLYEYLTTAIFYGPIVITYGIKSSAGVVFYIYALIIFLLLPIIPLIIATIIDMIIMRFTNIAKNKDAFRTISSILAILIIVGFNIFIQKSVASSGDKILEMIAEGDNSLINLAKNIFPSSVLGVNTLVMSQSLHGFINLILFIILTVIVVLFFLFLGELLYFKGVIGISETYSRRKRISDKELHKKASQGSKLITYILKELKNLFRVPAYFINCVLVSLLT